MSINILIKEKAINLRKEGKTYSEILKEVLIAKSTLSEWLRDVGLSRPAFQKLTKKRLEAAKRGGIAKHEQRIRRTEEIRKRALLDVKQITKRELWLIGTILYWAEGTKEKDFRPGTNISFNNSDPRMIKLFVKWLIKSCGISRERIKFEIYIHENSKNSAEDARKYWSKITRFPLDDFSKVYFKRTKSKTNRKNIGNLYYGLLRVKVSASSSFLRQITGWTEGIVRDLNCGIV